MNWQQSERDESSECMCPRPQLLLLIISTAHATDKRQTDNGRANGGRRTDRADDGKLEETETLAPKRHIPGRVAAVSSRRATPLLGIDTADISHSAAAGDASAIDTPPSPASRISSRNRQYSGSVLGLQSRSSLSLLYVLLAARPPPYPPSTHRAPVDLSGFYQGPRFKNRTFSVEPREWEISSCFLFGGCGYDTGARGLRHAHSYGAWQSPVRTPRVCCSALPAGLGVSTYR